MNSCETCGKFQEGLEIRSHWICEDCNHIPGNTADPAEWEKWDQPDQ